MRAETVLHPLGRAATRVLLHPAIRRLPGALALYAFLYTSAKHIAERGERVFLQERIRPGDVLLDIGANLGFYSTLFAACTGEAGRVFSFEPDPLMAGLLSSRTRRFPQVRVQNIGLGDAAGSAVLYCSRSNRADNRLAPSHRESTECVEVAIDRLDSWMAHHHEHRIDGLKMDVQGSEIAVLRGMSDLPAAAWPRWILFEFSPEHLRGAGEEPQELLHMLEIRGYVCSLLKDGRLHTIEDTADFERSVITFTNIFAQQPLAQ